MVYTPKAARRIAASAGCIAAAALWISVAETAGDEQERSQRAARPPASSPSGSEAPMAGGIVGSAHDFTAGGTVPKDLCLPCHTPHITAAQAPLLVSRDAGRLSQPSYRTRAGALNAASLVCLSCHDGSVARDVYAGLHAMSRSDLAAARLEPGRTRLTNHPVGIEYPTLDPKYNSPEQVAQLGRLRLPEGRIQCTTCHDPHNTQRHAGMLVISNERSRLCLACHRI